jgi:hypothetical protein
MFNVGSVIISRRLEITCFFIPIPFIFLDCISSSLLVFFFFFFFFFSEMFLFYYVYTSLFFFFLNFYTVYFS